MAPFYPISSATQRSSFELVQRALDGDWLLRLGRVASILILGVIVLLRPELGTDRQAIGWLLIVGIAPLSLAIDLWAKRETRFATHASFDLLVIVGCVAFLPAAWLPGLVIGGMLLGSRASSFVRARLSLYVLQPVLFIGSMALIGSYHAVPGGLLPLVAMAMCAPVLLLYAYAEQRHLRELRDRADIVESLAAMAGGVGHDFNNILTGIHGNGELLEQSLGANHKGRSHLRELLSASNRAKLLSSQLLAFSGGVVTGRERLNMRSEMRGLASMLQSVVPKGVELRLDIARELPLVSGDRAQLQQVIMNAILSAADAFGREKGVVFIVLRAVRYRKHEQLLVQVRSTALRGAVGESGLEDIFAIGGERTRRGIGLTAVRRVMREHGGAVEVHTSDDSAAVVTLRLPALVGTLAASDPDRVPVRPVPRKILFVDDEPQIRQVARALLEKLGHEVTVVEDGYAALRNIDVLKPEFDLVMLDIKMPGLSGWDTLERIDASYEGLPVLIQSGYEQDELSRALIERRANTAFVAKPYTSASLNSAISKVFADH